VVENFISKKQEVEKGLRKKAQPSLPLALKSENGPQSQYSFRQVQPPPPASSGDWQRAKDPEKATACSETVVKIKLPDAVFEIQAASERQSKEKRGIVILVASFPGGNVNLIEDVFPGLFD
jgi:hypothetical protein